MELYLLEECIESVSISSESEIQSFNQIMLPDKREEPGLPEMRWNEFEVYELH